MIVNILQQKVWSDQLDSAGVVELVLQTAFVTAKKFCITVVLL